MTKRVWALALCLILTGSAALPLTAATPGTPPAGAGRVAAALDAVLFEYLDARYGTARTAAVRAATRPGDFQSRLRELTGMDILQLGEAIMADADRRARTAPDPGGTPASSTVGPFVLHAAPASPAGRDLDLIAASMDSAFRRVSSALGLEAGITAAQDRLAQPGRIEVFLHASRQGESGKAIGPQGFGKTSLGATIRDGRAVLTAKIHILYLNALSLAVAEHEAAHAAVLLGVFDTPTFARHDPKDGDALKRAFFASYPAIPSFVQEGIGDWAVYAGGLYDAWGVFPPVDVLVRELRAAGRTLPITDLVAGDVRFRARHHKVYSLQAASFLNCLFDRFGPARVRAWLLAGEANGVKSFARVFGRGLADVEAGPCTTAPAAAAR